MYFYETPFFDRLLHFFPASYKESEMTSSAYIHISPHTIWPICKRLALKLNRDCHSGHKNMRNYRTSIIYFWIQTRIKAVTAVPLLRYSYRPPQIIWCLNIVGFIDIYLIISLFMGFYLSVYHIVGCLHNLIGCRTED
jgi:hypothetical protein